MIEPEEQVMGKERRSATDIIQLISTALTSEKQLIYNLSETTDLDHVTIERYLKLIVEVQELFQNTTLHYEEQKIGKKTYKSCWVSAKK